MHLLVAGSEQTTTVSPPLLSSALFLLSFILLLFLPDGMDEVLLWRANKPLPNNETQYGFTLFSMSLNEENESECLPGPISQFA